MFGHLPFLGSFVGPVFGHRYHLDISQIRWQWNRFLFIFLLTVIGANRIMWILFKPILKTFEASDYDKKRHKTRSENLEFTSHQALNVSLYSSDMQVCLLYFLSVLFCLERQLNNSLVLDMSRIFSHELLMRFSLVTTSIGHLDILRQQARIRLLSNNFVGLSG